MRNLLNKHNRHKMHPKSLIRRFSGLRPKRPQHLEFKLVESNFGSRMHILDNGSYESRGRSMRRLFDLAIETAEYADLRFNHFAICTDDQPKRINRLPTFFFCRGQEFASDEFLVPDFTFDSWPEISMWDYENERLSLMQSRGSEAKLRKIGWIGSLLTPMREEAFLQGQENDKYLDFRSIKWSRSADGGVYSADQMSFKEQQAEWFGLLDLAGHGWSARLKLLFAMGRPILIQDRPWTEWWHSKLQPHVHFAPVQEDLSDLLEVASRVLSDEDYASELVKNSSDFAQIYLSRDNAVKQLREVLLHKGESIR